MRKQKQFRRYVPVLLKEALDQLTYDRKDDLHVIIDLIHRKEIYYKSDYQNKYGYTEIALSQFKELLPSSDNLNRALDFLVNNSLLLRNDYYVIARQPKSYKLPKELLGKTVPVTITDKNINKRIAQQQKKYRDMKVKNLEFAKTEYYKTFRIDVEGANKAILERITTELKSLCYRIGVNLSERSALNIIQCKQGHEQLRFLILSKDKKGELDNIMHRYLIYTTRLNAIGDGFLFFKRNSTNGRLDTNLTSLPSFLRPYIIASEKLMNLDIKNSQPYFLYTLIQNNTDIDKAELERYGELVIGGTLYEYLEREYYNLTGYHRTRVQMKNMLYKIFFSKVESFQSQKKFFGGLFPSIMEYINKTNEKENNTLSIALQTKESYTILDVIMPLLEQVGIRPYTIHDSFVCKESEAVTIKELFVTKLTELYGIAPALHMDYLLPTPPEELTEWDEEFFEDFNAGDKAA